MSEVKTTPTPELWQKQAGFILKASWFSNKSDHKEDKEDYFWTKIIDHPKWKFNFSVLQSLHRSLEDALTAAKTFFKHSEFSANEFYIPPKYESSPINFSKKRRVGLIDKIMHDALEPKAEESGFLRTAFFEDGEYGLWVTIEETEYADEVERRFSDDDSPLRSFLDKECVAYLSYFFNDKKVLDKQQEYFTEEEIKTIRQSLNINKPYVGQKVLSGTLQMPEGLLSIGSWSFPCEGTEVVKGIPFLQTTLKGKNFGLLIRTNEKEA